MVINPSTSLPALRAVNGPAAATSNGGGVVGSVHNRAPSMVAYLPAIRVSLPAAELANSRRIISAASNIALIRSGGRGHAWPVTASLIASPADSANQWRLGYMVARVELAWAMTAGW